MAKNIDAEHLACEIRLRAERKAGQLLLAMEKAKGQQRRGNTTSPRGDEATLEERDIWMGRASR